MSAYKSKQQTKSHKKAYSFVALALLIVAGTGLVAYKVHQQRVQKAANVAAHSVRPENSINYSAASKADNDPNESLKSSNDTASTVANTNTSSSSTSQPTASFTVEILNAEKVGSGSSAVVHVGNMVSGITSGSCALTADKAGSSPVSASSTVQLDVNNYDCGPFNVPASSFSSSGDWQLTLTVTSNGSSASDTSTVTI